jgi:hypothetical protein
VTRLPLAGGLVLALLCAACKGAPIHIDNVVPSGIDHSTGRMVEGDAYGFQAMLLIPMGVNSRHERAWDELLTNAGDAYVTDVQLKETWYWALVGTLFHTTFRATAYPKNAADVSR